MIPIPRSRTLLTLYGAFLLAVGAVFLVIPGEAIAWYGAVDGLDPLETILARSVGLFMVGLGVVTWASRALPPGEGRAPVIHGMIVVNALSAAVSFVAAVTFPGMWFFWAEGAGFAFLSALFFLASRREEAGAREGYSGPGNPSAPASSA